MINYAHRGASQYAPENTLASFYLGIEMGANGIETDVRQTADGKLVLFHDDTLHRITGCDKSVEQLNYNELLCMDFGSYMGERYKNERIVLLEDFLKYFGGKELRLAIELKGDGIEQKTLQLIYQMIDPCKVTVTSFSLQHLCNLRALDSTITLGYLTVDFTETVMIQLVGAGIAQICPAAKDLTPKLVEAARSYGLTVRGWGVGSVELMKHCCDCGVDGMTVNFPDLLAKQLSLQ